jgi:hypothetical protein
MNTVADTFALVVEETIIDMLQESGAMSEEGDNIIDNLEKLGGRIRRFAQAGEQAEFVVLFMGDKIQKIMYIWVSGEDIMNVPMTEHELERVLNSGSKES